MHRYVNSVHATDRAVVRIFGDRKEEHTVMVWPATFLIGGVVFLFVGFSLGVAQTPGSPGRFKRRRL